MEEVKPKEITLFDHLNNLTEKKLPADLSNDEVKKNYKKYMISRYVSMCEFMIPIVNEANKFDLPLQVHYDYFLNILPQRKIYFQYIKKNKDFDKEEQKYIAHYFGVGIKEANMYINMLSEEQIAEILKIYTLGKNKMMEID